MNKNINFSLIISFSIAALFLGLISGIFIGRVSEPNANDRTARKQHIDIESAYTYPYYSRQDGKININLATLDQLIMIPGIGKVTGQRIIDYRNQFGFFHSLDELTAIEGIGEGTIEKMQPYATVGG